MPKDDELNKKDEGDTPDDDDGGYEEPLPDPTAILVKVPAPGTNDQVEQAIHERLEKEGTDLFVDDEKEALILVEMRVGPGQP